MSHGRPRRDLKFYYPTAEYTGYGEEKTNRRFSVLHAISDLGSKSLLDIGSGRCNLLIWLRANGYATHYEAVDVREEALRLCPCAPTHTHTGVPAPTGARAHEVICLFGTVTFNIGSDQDANRRLLHDLLDQSLALRPSEIVFTAIRSDRVHGLDAVQLVSFSHEEMVGIADRMGARSFTIHEEPDPLEWIVHLSFGIQ